MTVASYERDPATGGCLFPVVPKIIASTTPATTTSTRPNTPPDRQNTRSSNNPQQPLDIPTSFNLAKRKRSEMRDLAGQGRPGAAVLDHLPPPIVRCIARLKTRHPITPDQRARSCCGRAAVHPARRVFVCETGAARGPGAASACIRRILAPSCSGHRRWSGMAQEVCLARSCLVGGRLRQVVRAVGGQTPLQVALCATCEHSNQAHRSAARRAARFPIEGNLQR